MWCRRMSITLLLFVLSVIAHAVQPTEPRNTTGDVYEVQESEKKSSASVQPQQEKPTLREIVYHHVTERPYGKTVTDKPKPFGIGLDDSLRTFTNSHGFQYTIEHQGDSGAPPKHEDATAKTPAIRTEAKDLKMHQARETLLKKLAEMRKNLKNRKSNAAPATARPKRYINEMPEAPQLEEIDLPQLKYLFGTIGPEAPRAVVVGFGTKDDGNQLQDNTNDPTSKYSHVKLSDDHQPDIEDKVESIFATLKPFDKTKRNPTQHNHVEYLVEKEHDVLEGRNVGHDEHENTVEYVIDNDNTRDGRPDNIVTERPMSRPNALTYGMNLTLDHGYVWNKLVEPTVLYAIESQESEDRPTLSTLDVETNNAVTPTIEIDIDEQQVHPTEPQDQEDFDIYVDIKKHPKLNLTAAKNAKITNEQTTHKYHSKEDAHNDHEEEIDEEKENKHVKNRRPIDVDDDNNDKKDNIKLSKSVSDDDEEPIKKRVTHKKKSTHKRKPHRVQEPNKNEKIDLYHQLLDSDKFWNWLAQWTSLYTQYLTKAVKDMVKEEVENQLKNLNNKEPKLNKTKDQETISPAPGKHNKKVLDEQKDKPMPLNDKPDDGNNKSNNEKKLDQPSKQYAKLQELKLNNTISDYKQKSTEKPQDSYKFVTGDEKTTNIFILLPDASTKEIIQSIVGKPLDENKTNDKQINETPDKKPPQNEEQKNKDEGSKKPENTKNVNHEDNKPKDEKVKDEKSPNEKPINGDSKAEIPENEKAKDKKSTEIHEKSEDDKSIKEKPKNYKLNNEKQDLKDPEESNKPEVLTSNPKKR